MNTHRYNGTVRNKNNKTKQTQIIYATFT